jgi:lactoylglutathione lyase
VASSEDLVRRYVAMIGGSEPVSAVDEFVHPEFFDHVSGQTGTAIFPLVRRWGEETFADVETEVHAVMTNADLVSVWFTMRANHVGNAFPFLQGRPVTGRRVSYQAVHIFRVADGLLAEHWAVRDDLGLMRQLDEPKEPEVDTGRA